MYSEYYIRIIHDYSQNRDKLYVQHIKSGLSAWDYAPPAPPSPTYVREPKKGLLGFLGFTTVKRVPSLSEEQETYMSYRNEIAKRLIEKIEEKLKEVEGGLPENQNNARSAKAPAV